MKVETKIPTSTRGAALRGAAQEKLDAAGGEKIAAKDAKKVSEAERARYTDAVEQRKALLDEAKQLRADAADKLKGAVGPRGLFALENVARGFATLMNKLAGRTLVTVEGLKQDPDAKKTAAQLESLAAKKEADAQKLFEVAQRSWAASAAALAKAEGHERTAAAHTEAAAKLMQKAKGADRLAVVAGTIGKAVKAGFDVVADVAKHEGKLLLDEAKQELGKVAEDAKSRARADLRGLLQVGIGFLTAAVDRFFTGLEERARPTEPSSSEKAPPKATQKSTSSPTRKRQKKPVEPPSKDVATQALKKAEPHLPAPTRRELEPLFSGTPSPLDVEQIELRSQPVTGAAQAFAAIKDALARGENVSAASRDVGPFVDSGIVPSHIYAITGVSEAGGGRLVEVKNPWGGDALKLPAEKFAALFDTLHMNASSTTAPSAQVAEPAFVPGKVDFAPSGPRAPITIKGPRIDEPPKGEKKISESFLAARWAAEAAGIDWVGKGAGELKKLIETHKGGLKLSHGASPFEAKKRLAERMGLPTASEAIHALSIDDVRMLFAQREAIGLSRLTSKSDFHRALDAAGLKRDAGLDELAMYGTAKGAQDVESASKDLKGDLESAERKAAFERATAALDKSKRVMLDVLASMPAGDRRVLALDACDAVEAAHGKLGATTKLGFALENLTGNASFASHAKKALGLSDAQWRAAVNDAAKASEWIALGELAAPSAVLAYPGPLTAAQKRDVIAPLARAGTFMAKELALLDDAALAALDQHMTFKGVEPASAQLLGLVRQLSALAERRDYRTKEALSKDDILNELAFNCGRLWKMGTDGKEIRKDPPSLNDKLVERFDLVIDEALKSLR